jgi:hypothetical protein
MNLVSSHHVEAEKENHAFIAPTDEVREGFKRSERGSLDRDNEARMARNGRSSDGTAGQMREAAHQSDSNSGAQSPDLDWRQHRKLGRFSPYQHRARRRKSRWRANLCRVIFEDRPRFGLQIENA